MQAGLQRGLLALQRAFLAADFIGLRLRLLDFGLESGDLILAAQDGRRRFAIGRAVERAAGVNTLAVQEVAVERREIVSTVGLLPRGGGGGEVGDNAGVAEQAVDEVGDRLDRKSTRLNSSHIPLSRMPSSA